MKPWSNLAHVVYKRTYSRKDTGNYENWADTVERVIAGNVRLAKVPEHEIQRLRYFMMERKAGPAGRGLWFSGAPAHARIGGAALVNCYSFAANDWMNYVYAQDLLMLGGGVGMSVEHRFVSKLPRVKKDVEISHRLTKDASFIVPDSREGWIELTRRVLESFLVTGKGFDYSTICIRGQGEPIKGFGGSASGPAPVVEFVTKLSRLMKSREGKMLRPVDAGDVLCLIAELVVAGNVRRSALLLLGDPFDKDFLRAKRWDLGNVPPHRANANYSVVCDDIDDLHPLFWKTYENGEPFGIVNRTNIQKYGRMGEIFKDSAYLVNPCSEATLEDGESCNLQEVFLGNITDVSEFEEAARLMHRYGKRVTLENFHISKCDETTKRNRRIGTGISGCLKSPLFNAQDLDRVYAAIQEENIAYSKELGIDPSIRTTVIKPSGTTSKVADQDGYEGLHAAWSRYMIQRIRFAADDPDVRKLAAAGHHIEPAIKLDGTLDHRTVVVDFYVQAPDGYPVADEDWSTWKQLDTVKFAQKHWADQAVSVTVYYKKEEIPQLKEWLRTNLSELKTISFLCHNDHGFKQAPKEAIDKATFERLSSKIKPVAEDIGGDELQDSMECSSGACPIR